MGCAVSAFALVFLCGTRAPGRSASRQQSSRVGGVKAPRVRTSQPMPRSRAMTRHAASGLAFMAMACLRVGGLRVGGLGVGGLRGRRVCVSVCMRDVLAGRPGRWRQGYGCYRKRFEHSGTCVAEGGKAALMLPSVVLSWSRS